MLQVEIGGCINVIVIVVFMLQIGIGGCINLYARDYVMMLGFGGN